MTLTKRKYLILLFFCIILVVSCAPKSRLFNRFSKELTPESTKTENVITPETSEIYDELAEIILDQNRREGAPVWSPKGWSPDGFEESAIQQGSCNATNIRDIVIGQMNPLANSQFVSDSFIKCESKWKTGKKKLSALLEFSAFQYKYENNKNIKQVKIRLENNKIIRGLFALKPGTEKRPLVIAVCGLLCEAGDRVSQYLLAQLFDDTPFHVLVISNGTTQAFLEDNDVSGFGGLIGADSIVRLARYFRNPFSEYQKIISSVHAFGISLGSHEAIYSSILNTFHFQNFGDKPISSFIAMCPVTDFPATLHSIFKAPLKSQIAKVGLKKLIRNTSSRLGISYPETFDDEMAAPSSFVSFLTEIYVQNLFKYQNIFSKTAWSFPTFTTKEEIIQASNLNYFSKNIEDPMLLLASEDDPVVNTELNLDTLRNTNSANSSYILPTKLSEGSHCALSVSYGWRNTSFILQSFILANDTAFSANLKKYRATFTNKTIDRIKKIYNRTNKIITYRWNVNLKKKQAELKIIFPKYHRPISCNNSDYEFNNVDCKMTLTIETPLNKFPRFISDVSNSTEARAAERWLNVQVRLLDEKGKDVNISKKMPIYSEYVEL